MNFHEAENYLLSLGNEVATMKLGLDSVSKLFADLGNPQKNYLKVQVAGTNGKGSVCAFLNSICVTAGIRTGMYTSPHLVSITERIQIDGVEIDRDGFARLATIVRDTSEKLVDRGELESVPTFFEQVTAIALLTFADANIELAILETGLGGRLDATTAANAEIAAITRIDIDHQQYLGETLEEIAAEKAAIIRSGSRAVVGEQAERAMNVVLRRCNELDLAPRLASQSVLPLENVRLGLAGHHQLENAKVAVSVAELLREHFRITDLEIVKGLEAAHHPGRLETIGKFLLDGAHNVGSAGALRKYLDEFVSQPITVIFGSMNDKDVKEIGKILFPIASRLIFTKPDNSRALSPDILVRAIPDTFDPRNVIETPDVRSAIRKAEELSETGIIVVTGSLYLVGEARKLLLEPSE